MASLKKQVTLCTVGSILEWYDFSLFACLTPILSQIFFPSSNQLTGLMGTFVIFASGYFVRPIGAIFFGELGDRIGRKYSLLITIFTMTVATTMIGLIPKGGTYAALMLVLCRLAQGFACSGEYPGMLTLLSEQCSSKRQSFISSTGGFATCVGSMLGALLYVVLLASLGQDRMLDWGWRIPFLLGAPLGIFGYLLRKYIYESSEFIRLKENNLTARTPLFDLFRAHRATLLAGLSVSILTNTIIMTNYVYLGNYALSIHKITSAQVIYLQLTVQVVYAFSILLFGFMADYVNKRLLILSGCLLFMIGIYPLFNLILTGDIYQQFLGQAVIAFGLGIVLGPFTSVLPEQFPARVRFSGLSVILNFAASFFGGTAPIVCGWLTKISGSPTMPAVYLILISGFACWGMIYIYRRKPVEVSIGARELAPT